MSRADVDTDGSRSLSDKLRHPIHEIKQKLAGSHLHDVKVALHHKKYSVISAR